MSIWLTKAYVSCYHLIIHLQFVSDPEQFLAAVPKVTYLFIVSLRSLPCVVMVAHIHVSLQSSLPSHDHKYALGLLGWGTC
jgi:hypothetical protein